MAYKKDDIAERVNVPKYINEVESGQVKESEKMDVGQFMRTMKQIASEEVNRISINKESVDQFKKEFAIHNRLIVELPLTPNPKQAAAELQASISANVQNIRILEDPLTKLGEFEHLLSMAESLERSISYAVKRFDNYIPTRKTPPSPQHFNTSLSIAQLGVLYEELIQNGYINSDADKDSFIWAFGGCPTIENVKRMEWIKPVSTTHGKNISMMSLLNFLTLLGISEEQIKNKQIHRTIFSRSGNSHAPSNANYIDAKAKKYKSEYHTELNEILKKILI